MSEWIYWPKAPRPADCLEMFAMGVRPSTAEFFNALETAYHEGGGEGGADFQAMIEHLDTEYLSKLRWLGVLKGSYIANKDWVLTQSADYWGKGQRRSDDLEPLGEVIGRYVAAHRLH